MDVRLVPVDSVIPYARNPRKNAGAVAKVASSLREFGFRQPIVVDPEMTVVVGHTRLQAAVQLGMKEVPVHVATWRGKAGHASMGKNRTGVVLADDKADWREAWDLFPGNIAYVWHGGLHSGTVAESLTASGFSLRAQIIWNKSVMAMSRGDYHWKHEPCWYAVRGTGNWTGDRKQTTVWDLKSPIHIMSGSDEVKTSHPTQKPVECHKRPIENNSSPGQAVYEPFSGSGTTIIAAEMTGRHCHAIELNPAYVDVAIKRWQDFTGQKAVHAETGATFEQTDTERYAKAGAPDNSAKSYDAAIDVLRQRHEAAQQEAAA
jgi:hypothetical protein